MGKYIFIRLYIIVQATLSKTSGSWNLKLPGSTSSVVIAEGKITVDGKPAEVISSKNPKFPTSANWFSIVLDDGKIGFGRLSPSGEDLEIQMVKGETVFPATVEKEGSGPKVPADGK